MLPHVGSKLLAEDVLSQLDDDAREQPAFFPDFDHGYHYHVDGRLTAYGDGARWVVVIEQLAVNPRGGGVAGVHTTLYYHGNAVILPPQPGWGEHAVQTVIVLEDGPRGPFVDDTNSVVSPEARDVRIRGEVVPISQDPNYYWARKIDVEALTHEQIDEWIEAARHALAPDMAEEAVRHYEEDLRPKVGKFELDSWHVLRALVPEQRELLLATDAERRRGVPSDLPLLLQLDDWDHPRLMEGELPRSSVAFKQIARALASGDPSKYAPDLVEGNVHWSNWPESGNL
jgi:hypothetical protein